MTKLRLSSFMMTKDEVELADKYEEQVLEVLRQLGYSIEALQHIPATDLRRDHHRLLGDLSISHELSNNHYRGLCTLCSAILDRENSHIVLRSFLIEIFRLSIRASEELYNKEEAKNRRDT